MNYFIFIAAGLYILGMVPMSITVNYAAEKMSLKVNPASRVISVTLWPFVCIWALFSNGNQS